MWPRISIALTLLLTATASPEVFAKRARKNVQSAPPPSQPALESETLFEAEPRIGAPVMRDPEILNRDEMLSLVKKYSGAMAEALMDGERQREKAVRTKDAIKLACIQDRLSNMKSMKKLSDERAAATERTSIRADDLRLRHEFRGVEMAHQRVVELHRELMECVGQSLEVTGAPTDAPASNNPTGTNVALPGVERPAPASTYR